MGGGVEGFVVVFSGYVERGGEGEFFGAAGFAFLLHGAQFGDVLFSAAVQARLLQLQVAQPLFVFQVGFEFDLQAAFGGVEMFESVGEFDSGFGFEREHQVRDTAETPFGVGDGLHQGAFDFVGRPELVTVGGDVFFVEGDVFRSEEDGAAGEGGGDGVQRRFGPAFFGLRTRGEKGVGLDGGNAGA